MIQYDNFPSSPNISTTPCCLSSYRVLRISLSLSRYSSDSFSSRLHYLGSCYFSLVCPVQICIKRLNNTSTRLYLRTKRKREDSARSINIHLLTGNRHRIQQVFLHSRHRNLEHQNKTKQNKTKQKSVLTSS